MLKIVNVVKKASADAGLLCLRVLFPVKIPWPHVGCTAGQDHCVYTLLSMQGNLGAQTQSVKTPNLLDSAKIRTERRKTEHTVYIG